MMGNVINKVFSVDNRGPKVRLYGHGCRVQTYDSLVCMWSKMIVFLLFILYIMLSAFMKTAFQYIIFTTLMEMI